MACLCAMALISSCGEMFQQEWPEEFDPEKLPDVSDLGDISLGDKEDGFYILYVGDEKNIDPKVGDVALSTLTDSLKKIVLSRFVARADYGDSIVKVRQTAITAMGVGTDTIKFSDADGDWSTKVPVAVLPVWTKERVATRRYETIVYAEVTVNGTAPARNVMFAALDEKGELRARGVSRTAIHFEGYDPTNRCLVTFVTTITFDGGTHGTLSELFELNGNR